MDGVNNNHFEVKSNSKRKINVPCPNVYLNPALDLLANDDKICNTAMEIVPKKRKRTKSDVASFENTGLDIGKKVINEFLVREIDNVRRNVKNNSDDITDVNLKETVNNNAEENCFTNEISAVTHNFNLAKDIQSVGHINHTTDQIFNDTKHTADNINTEIIEPIYANLTESKNETDSTIDCADISRIPKDYELDSGISEQKSSNITNIQTNISNQVVINNSNLSLSFIDRLALNSPTVSDQSLFFDDDLNESNIMEIKTITIITKKKRIVEKKNTNPFLDPKLNKDFNNTDFGNSTNPFLDIKPDLEYDSNRTEEKPEASNNVYQDINNTAQRQEMPNTLMPRRLFDTNSTISTGNDSIEIHEYENAEAYRVESPIYENIDDLNKQSKILGHDVSHFSAVDIMNLNKLTNNSNDSQESKKKHSLLKVGNKLSKKVFKTLKKTFKHDKVDTTLNPYEVPRKPPKIKEVKKESGIENPALNLDISDDLEIEEISDEEHHYETIKTRRNTELNMNVTPLKARDNEIDFLPNKTNTPGKKVRFDSTLNREKVITGNSFDYGIASPGFDAKIEKYHDELENCINERKFLQQNM